MIFRVASLLKKGASMSIAGRLQHYIEREGVAYDIVPHHRTATTSQSAQAAHIPGSRLAKAVVVHHEAGYLLAVVPSTHRVELTTLQDAMDRRLGLASEDEVCQLFSDCEEGAAPPLGMAYDVPVVLDESFGHVSDVYFEAGDHRNLVHVTGPNFLALMKDAQIARIGRPH